MKKIVFIEPAGKKTNVFDNYMRLPLIGSLYLGSILRERGYEVEILNENILAREIDPFEINADVFCVTALTVSANRAKLLASQLKRTHPDSLVIMGGIHATLLPEEFTDVADHVVLGEAEGIIFDLVEGKFDEKIVNGFPLEDLDSLPLINYDLLEGRDNMGSVPIMASRGCPFDCNFCTVTQIFGKRFRMQSPKRILAEIENALKYFKTKSFFFYDDNFTSNKRRVGELCDLIIERGLKISWTAQVRSDLARDPELIAKMALSGLNWVFIGFESINDETLKSLHKSQTRADIEKAIRVFLDAGVFVHGMFMFGADTDTVESIRETVEFAIDHEIDTVQFMILTPFPGTRFYENIVGEDRLFHRNWEYFNGMFPVHQPKNMSALKLINETYAAYERFYSFRRTLLDTLYLVFSVSLDALVWNFNRVNRYGIDNILIRGGAKALVSKYSKIYRHYQDYLGEIERGKVLEVKNP